jgi:hypothetical protein
MTVNKCCRKRLVAASGLFAVCSVGAALVMLLARDSEAGFKLFRSRQKCQCLAASTAECELYDLQMSAPPGGTW